MHTICWSPKGGSGTTVVAATIALAAPRPTLLIDFAGDLAACLGAAEPPTGDGPSGSGHDGILDWLRSDAAPERLDDLAQPIEDGLDLIRRGTLDGGPIDESRWGSLASLKCASAKARSLLVGLVTQLMVWAVCPMLLVTSSKAASRAAVSG